MDNTQNKNNGQPLESGMPKPEIQNESAPNVFDEGQVHSLDEAPEAPQPTTAAPAAAAHAPVPPTQDVQSEVFDLGGGSSAPLSAPVQYGTKSKKPLVYVGALVSVLVIAVTVFFSISGDEKQLTGDVTVPTANDDSDGLTNYEEFQNGTNPYESDSDGDDINDSDEVNSFGTNPILWDSDQDLIPDLYEIKNGFDPMNEADPPYADSAYQGMSQAVLDYILDTVGTGTAEEDRDEDGLINEVEIALGTNLAKEDSDGDGLSDYYEVNTSNTDPNTWDSDGDFISDAIEDKFGLSDPNNIDTDGDSINDNDEDLDLDGVLDPNESDPSDPCDPNSCTIGSTSNQLPDLISNVKYVHGTGLIATVENNGTAAVNPSSINPDMTLSIHKDGTVILPGINLAGYSTIHPIGSSETITIPEELFGSAEYVVCIDINDGVEELDETNNCSTQILSGPVDTDGDGLVDSIETNSGVYKNETNVGTSPRNPDTDGDGLSDGLEANTLETDPNNVDTDGDGINDGTEVENGSSPLDPCDPTCGSPYIDLVVMSLRYTGGVGIEYEVGNIGTLEMPFNADDVSLGVSISKDSILISNEDIVSSEYAPFSYAAPGGSQTITYPYSLTGSASFEVCIDSGGDVDEIDDDNNCLTKQLTDEVDITDPDPDPDPADPVDPLDPADPLDTDGDGLLDVDEPTYGVDPNNPDTDGDGLLDGEEVVNGTDPADTCDPDGTIPGCPGTTPTTSSGGGGGGGGGGYSSGGGGGGSSYTLPFSERHTPSTVVGVDLTSPDEFEEESCYVKRSGVLTDMRGHFAEDSVNTLYTNSIVDGEMNSRSRFGHSRPITRAEFMKIVSNALCLEVIDPLRIKRFQDVSLNTWFAGFVDAVARYDIVNGYADGLFRPANELTRAEALKILVNAVTDTRPTYNSTLFTDGNSHWATAYIEAARRAEFVRGYSDGTVRPNNSITRAEAAVLVDRIIVQNEAWQDYVE